MTSDQRTAAEICKLLHLLWQATPNEPTNSALTSFEQNHIGPGVSWAIDAIKRAYKLNTK